MKKVVLFLALAVGLFASATTQAQNMSRYITLTVKSGEAISLDLKAAATGTPVRIVSGSNTQDITVGTDWTGFISYTAGSTVMTVYGDIISFDCSNNGANITALDLSHNTQLVGLRCYFNALTSLDVSQNTQLTELYCYSNQLSSLDVSQNTQLTKLSCEYNNLSSLDVSQNTELTMLYCHSNQLTALDVSNNTQLTMLYCYSNQLTALDVLHNTQLTELRCFSNRLTALDVSGCTQLKMLNCRSNELTALDVSECTQLTELRCFSNRLTALDVSNNTQLKKLICYDNNFTTDALDDIYCALPDRTGTTKGYIYPAYYSFSSNNATVIATNKTNATAKNWNVWYSANDTDIPTTGTYVCGTPHLDIYITLTVKSGEAISLDFKAAQANTPIRIVSGSNTQDITVGKNWNGTASYTAGSTTMTIYGDIIGFDCNDNGANLTALDVSNNTQLTRLYCGNNNISRLDVSNNTQLHTLYCYGNNFTTAALDDIYCALPDRTGTTKGHIYTAYSSSSSYIDSVLATNAANATAKNWKVQYYQNDTDITTNGIYVCGTPHIEPNMSRYITLTVAKDSAIKLNFKVAADGTHVRIVSGSTIQNIIVGTGWTGTIYYTAADTVMTVYGDIIGFVCDNNGANLTALDLSHNTQLTDLSCSKNNLSSLDLSNNTQLTVLWCEGNNLSNLDVSNNTQLTVLDCSKNNLSNLDLSNNTQLNRLECRSNQLSSLDVSQNTQLTMLYCHSNQLTALDVSNNTQLTELYCYGNNFSTAALDDIYCALPDRKSKTNGVIHPIYDSSSSDTAIVAATNAQNAIAKNWKVQYYYGITDIPATTGTYVCGTSHANMDTYITLTVAKDSAIKLDFKAAADGTPVRIVSGSNTQDITVGTGWTGSGYHTAADTVMTVYGNLTGFDCSDNKTNVSALDVSNNTLLTKLYCSNNQLTALDVSNNTLLVRLSCYYNKLSSLDVSNNTQLTELVCYDNNLSSLDVSNNTQLTKLDCSYNQLTALDVSNNTQLTRLYCESNKLSNLDVSHNTQLMELVCYRNKLTTLDVSNNTQLTELYCRENNLSNLDVSHNTQLRFLNCNGNNFTTATLDDIYCALPVRQASDNARIQPIYNSSSSDTAIVAATNAQNAIAKNWKVQYYYDNTDIPATTGTYECGTPHTEPNMSRYITLTVAKDSAIKLDFKAAADGTPVRIVSGSNTQDITVGTNWYNGNNPSTFTVTADDTVMTVYGDLTGFECRQNGANLTALDLSHNTELTYLSCSNNNLSSLDVSNNTQLTRLDCFYNQLTALDVSLNTLLTELHCFYNQLTALDVSLNTLLTELHCYRNQLASLDVSNNTQLTGLDCSYNQLTALDVSNNTQLTWLSCESNQLSNLDVSLNTLLTRLYCWGNNFTTAALDDIYCALPDRNDSTNGVIYPIYDSSSSDTATVKATNAQNAISKNWEVRYYRSNTDIPATTGTYTCPTTDIAEASAEPQLTLYPNPVADVLYLSATARTIRVYDIYGTEVAHATDTDHVEISHLPAGVYMVKADGTVAKMVKR